MRRRADRIDLHAVSIKKVESSYLKLFAAAGFTLSSETAKKAAAATTGYPFLVQLIGYFLWREAEKEGGTLTDVAAERAIAAGLKRNIRLVIAPAIAHASSRDMDYLQAMAQDQETSSTGEIARRMGAKLTLAANYRARLIDAGLIESVRHGEVKFSIPGLREYLRSTPLRS